MSKAEQLKAQRPNQNLSEENGIQEIIDGYRTKIDSSPRLQALFEKSVGELTASLPNQLPDDIAIIAAMLVCEAPTIAAAPPFHQEPDAPLSQNPDIDQRRRLVKGLAFANPSMPSTEIAQIVTETTGTPVVANTVNADIRTLRHHGVEIPLRNLFNGKPKKEKEQKIIFQQ